MAEDRDVWWQMGRIWMRLVFGVFEVGYFGYFDILSTSFEFCFLLCYRSRLV